MTGYRVVITEAAEFEIAQAVVWYKTRSLRAAETFKHVVSETVEVISHSPLSWPRISQQGVRRVILPRFPYSIFYSVSAEWITILALAHHRREPRDWNQV